MKRIINKIKLTGGHLPSEFKEEKDIYDLFYSHNLMMGRIICGSKSTYMQKYPQYTTIFNANVITKSRGKIWHGDLSFPPDAENMQKICNKLRENIYILREMDARFGNEKLPIEELIKKAVIVLEPKI